MIPNPTTDPLQRWFTKAYQGELTTLQQLPDENSHRPDAVFFGCLLRICALLKGTRCAYCAKEAAKDEVVQIVYGQLGLLSAKEVRRQFENAWRMARPRRPQQRMREPGKAYRWGR